MDDPLWTTAQVVDLPIEMQPGENIPAPQRTTVHILWNQDYVYFGFRCFDGNPAAIRAHITDRDKIFDDDYVIVLLDTYGDNQRTYELFVNPYGIQGDILRTGSNEDDSFDTVWESAAALNDSGWTAEMAIPFKSLRFPVSAEQRWIMLLGRNYPRESRSIFANVPINRDNPCLICQGIPLLGIRNVEATSSFDVLPYVVGMQRGSLNNSDDPSQGFYDGDVLARFGGGFRYAPNPDFSVDAVVNPDFSQVESDARQINVNSTFALFYPEKRPFFLLGNDLFQNNTGTFYSRTINNPIGAGKIVGKTGSLSYAYLAAGDRNTPFIIPGEEQSDNKQTSVSSVSNVARLRYDFGSESFLGAMVTARNTSTYHNLVGGIDWNYFFGGFYYFRGEVFASDTKEPEDTTLYIDDSWQFGSTGYNATFNGERYQGTAANIQIMRNARDYGFNLSYRDYSPTFQAHNGFVSGNDNRMVFFNNWYSFYPNNEYLDLWNVELDAGLHYNYDGVRKERWCIPNMYFQMKSQTNVSFGYFLVNDELFKGVQFEGISRGYMNVNSRPSSAVNIGLHAEVGKFIKRKDVPTMGKGHNISLSTTLRPTSQLQLDLSYSRARLSDAATEELFYDGYIGRAVGIYQFTAELFFRLITQYDSFDKSFDVYPLLSYKLNPFTIFYAGATTNVHDYGDPFGLRQTARQFFVKLQYLVRS